MRPLRTNGISPIPRRWVVSSYGNCTSWSNERFPAFCVQSARVPTDSTVGCPTRGRWILNSVRGIPTSRPTVPRRIHQCPPSLRSTRSLVHRCRNPLAWTTARHPFHCNILRMEACSSLSAPRPLQSIGMLGRCDDITLPWVHSYGTVVPPHDEAIVECDCGLWVGARKRDAEGMH